MGDGARSGGRGLALEIRKVAFSCTSDYLSFVPVYAPDLELLEAARRYVDDVHGSVVKRAAQRAKIDYAMFRRFLKKGSASPENRQHIRNALQGQGPEIVIRHKVAHEIPIDVTRAMLTQLLEALDAYQGATSTAREPAS
jgi:hypothetical protein